MALLVLLRVGLCVGQNQMCHGFLACALTFGALRSGGNRSEKFRFRRHVAKANFYLLNYEKKPIKLAFADYEAQNFNLSLNPPFYKTLVSGCPVLNFLSIIFNHHII